MLQPFPVCCTTVRKPNSLPRRSPSHQQRHRALSLPRPSGSRPSTTKKDSSLAIPQKPAQPSSLTPSKGRRTPCLMPHHPPPAFCNNHHACAAVLHDIPAQQASSPDSTVAATIMRSLQHQCTAYHRRPALRLFETRRAPRYWPSRASQLPPACPGQGLRRLDESG